MTDQPWVMQCLCQSWQSDPFAIYENDPAFEAATESMARHVLGAHDGADSARIVMRRTEDLEPATSSAEDDGGAGDAGTDMVWLLNCWLCGRWVSRRKGGDTDVLDGEVGYPRCHQCVQRDDERRRELAEARRAETAQPEGA